MLMLSGPGINMATQNIQLFLGMRLSELLGKLELMLIDSKLVTMLVLELMLTLAGTASIVMMGLKFFAHLEPPIPLTILIRMVTPLKEDIPIILLFMRYCFKIPESYPLEKAAPLLCAGTTVYSPMVWHNMNQPGKSLGVIGLGGLGHMAVKFGKAFGPKVIVLSTSE